MLQNLSSPIRLLLTALFVCVGVWASAVGGIGEINGAISQSIELCEDARTYGLKRQAPSRLIRAGIASRIKAKTGVEVPIRKVPEVISVVFRSGSTKTVKAWKGIFDTPTSFRTNTGNLESVSKYMDDFAKSADDIAGEIAGTSKGHQWWFDYILGRKYWTRFLDDAAEAQKFADDIIDFNKATEGGGVLFSGTPSSAINTASYYDDALEQGASIFKTIIKNHMFADGNKRTAMNMMKSYMNKAGVIINKTDAEILEIATKVEADIFEEVSDIANKMIE